MVINKTESQAYLHALQHAWKDVWMARRGQGALEEYDPKSMTGINVRAQILELRQSVHASVAYAFILRVLPYTNSSWQQASWRFGTHAPEPECS